MDWILHVFSPHLETLTPRLTGLLQKRMVRTLASENQKPQNHLRTRPAAEWCFSKEFSSGSYGRTEYRAHSRQHRPPSRAYVLIPVELCLSSSKEPEKAGTIALSPQGHQCSTWTPFAFCFCVYCHKRPSPMTRQDSEGRHLQMKI